MSIILIITICLLVIVTAILIWGGVTNWKFIPKKKEYAQLDDSKKIIKKGVWQKNDHINSYGNSFKNVKDFGLTLPEDVITKLKKKSSMDRDIYEFGVYTGGSMRDIVKLCKNKNIKFNNLWGFDSFEGLPNEDSLMIKQGQTEGKHWKKGAFSAADALDEYNYEKLLKTIDNKINYERTGYIKGYFENVLTSELILSLPFQKAIFIDIDVDLYKSAYECLDWLFKNKLINKGTIIRYDDWRGTDEWKGGESLAHKQITEKYNIKCNRLHQNIFEII